MSLFSRPSRDPLADPAPLVRRVYSYVAYRLGDGPDAEDVTNEVFERALRYRSNFDPAKGEPVSWLLGIARRCVDSTLAQRVDTASEVTERSDPADLEGETVVRLGLADSLARLPRRDRDLIALRYGADLTAAQIAAVFEMTTNAVEVALHRALARLRALLENESAEEDVRVRPPSPVSDVEAGATQGGG
jgi:RNA polymerase sigma factor (sigma-70 family)